MHMKRSLLALLFAPVALTSCQTAHDAAVSTFRVLDAPQPIHPAQTGVRPERRNHHHNFDDNGAAERRPPNDNVYAQPYQQAPPPPPPQYTERTTVNTAPRRRRSSGMSSRPTNGTRPLPAGRQPPRRG